MRSLLLIGMLGLGATLGWVLTPYTIDGNPSSTSAELPGNLPTPTALGLAGTKSQVEETALAAILSRYAAHSYPGGPGEITGTVFLYGTETPLPGIAIDAVIHGATPGASQDGIDQPDLLHYIREEIEQFHYDQSMVRRAVTDEEGRFRITDLPADSEYHLHPAPNEEWFTFSRKGGRNFSPGSEVQFFASPLAHVTVDVVRSDGSAVPSGTIALRDPDDRSFGYFRERFTPDHRTIRVPIHFCEMDASTEEDETSERVYVELSRGDHPTVRLTVKGEPGIDVTIRASNQIDLLWCDVTAVPIDRIEADEDLCEFRYGIFATESPDEFGVLSIDNTPGRYLVFLCREDEVLDQITVDVGEGRRQVTLSAPPRTGENLAFFEVLGPAGHPIDEVGVSVFAQLQFEGKTPDRSFEVDCAYEGLGDGNYVVTLIETLPWWADEESPLLGYEASISTSELGVLKTSLLFGSPSVQRVQFFDPAVLEVELVDYVGHELQGRVSVRIVPLDRDAEGAMSESSFNAVGTASIGPITPGRQRLVLVAQSAGDWDWDGKAIRELEISLVPGENFLAIELPGLYSLRARFPGGRQGDEAGLEDGFGESISDVELDGDGVAEFHHLRAGRYRISGKNQYEFMSIILPGDSNVVFASDVIDGLMISTVGLDGWFARAGFRAGDRIVGIDGASFPSARRLQVEVLRAIERGEGELEIDRAGSDIRLPIPADERISLYDLKRALQPAGAGEGPP